MTDRDSATVPTKGKSKRRIVPRRPWKERALEVMEDLVEDSKLTGRTFSAIDLRAMVGEPDPTLSANAANNIIGAIFREFSTSGIIEFTGKITPSTTPSRKGGMIRVWKARSFRPRRKLP